MSRPAGVWWCCRHARQGITLALAVVVGCRKDGATPAPDSLAVPAVVAPPATAESAGAIDSATSADPLVVLRDTVARELGQPVTLVIDKRRGDDRWTFVTAAARTVDGRKIDYTRTKFAAAVKDGVFDDWLCALLERRGTAWTVVALEIGATDVPFVDWPDRFGVPREIVTP